MILNRIKQAALERHAADEGLRIQLAARADATWEVLRTQLEGFSTSEMGLVMDYLVARARAYRAERGLSEIQAAQQAALENRRAL